MYPSTHRITALVLAISGLIGLNSCEPEEVWDGGLENGVYVLHQGTGGWSTASVSFVNRTTYNVTNNIQPIGVSPDHSFMTWDMDDRNGIGYLCSDPGGLVKFDLESQLIIGTLNDNLGYQRDVKIVDDQNGYVVYDNNTLYHFNPTSMVILESIDLNSRSHCVAVIGDHILVGTDNSVLKLSSINNSVVDSIEIFGYKSFVVDQNSKLWVLNSDDPSLDGRLIRINPVNMSIELNLQCAWTENHFTTVPAKLKIDKFGSMLYWVGAKQLGPVFRMHVDATQLPTDPFIDIEALSVGIDPVTNNLFVGYQVFPGFEGQVLVYNSDGVLIETLDVGDTPYDYHFVFNQ